MNSLRFIRYLPRVFLKRGMPLNLIYFVTTRCNAKCEHCFYWRELNTPKQELNLEQIEKVAKGVPNLLSLSLTGGEPFLRNNLAEITFLFSKFTKVANIQIPTNGLLTEHIFRTTNKILDGCRKDSRIVVSVSLDDIAEKHDQIRNVEGCFQKAIETIKQLKTLESKFSNFCIGSTITMTNTNQERVINLIDFLKDKLDIKEVGVNLIRSEVRDMRLKELDIKRYDQAALKLKNDFSKRFKQSKKPSWVERILWARQYCGSKLLSKIYSKNKYITPCYAGSLLAIMREDGDIYPCEMLDAKIGSLKDFDFNLRRLWFSQPAEEVRKKIKKDKCFCTYECAMTLNTLFNPCHLFSILRDSLRRKVI